MTAIIKKFFENDSFLVFNENDIPWAAISWNAPLFIQDTEPSVTVPSLWIDTTWWNFSFNLVTP